MKGAEQHGKCELTENVHGSCIHFDEIHDYVDPQTKHTYTSLPHAHSLVSCYVEWEEDIRKDEV